MKCFEKTGCSEEQRKACYLWNSFQPDSHEMENIQCWVIKGVYHPDQKIQFTKCKKCKYYFHLNQKTEIVGDIKEDVAIIRCEGSLNNDRVKALDFVWEEIKKNQKEHVILDISMVTNIYSCAFGVMIKMHKEINSLNGVLVITGAQEFTMSLFKRLHLESILHLEADNATAMKIFEARIQERLEQQRIQEEIERAKNAPRKRMPCWEYWNNKNTQNTTNCDSCYRKISENTNPCWIINGYIEGISFLFVSEDCLLCGYYKEFKNSIETPSSNDGNTGFQKEEFSELNINVT